MFGCFIIDVPTTKLLGFMRALRIVYDDDVSTFDQLHVMNKFFCIYHQNIQGLDVSGNSLKELLVQRGSTVSLPSKAELVIPSVNSVLKGKSSLRYFGSVFWNSLLIESRKVPVQSDKVIYLDRLVTSRLVSTTVS